jgi:MHS family proline/betaine transporter-like MFS transporter
MLLIPFCSFLTDRMGYRKALMIVAIGNIVYAPLCFYWLQLSTVSHALWILMPLILFSSLEQGTTPVTVTSNFPAIVRYTGVSFAYNVAMAFFGGTAPMYNTWLVSVTHIAWMPGVAIATASLLSLIAVMFYVKPVQSLL